MVSTFRALEAVESGGAPSSFCERGAVAIVSSTALKCPKFSAARRGIPVDIGRSHPYNACLSVLLPAGQEVLLFDNRIRHARTRSVSLEPSDQ